MEKGINDNTVMSIVIGASKEYSFYAPILLLSLYESNKHKFHIYYYYNEEMNELIEYMEQISEQYGQEFTPMFVAEERIAGTEKCDVWHNSTWYRWLCLDDLNGICDRVLILGTDIIVTKDIQQFYFQNLEDKCMAAVQDSVNIYDWYILYDECEERGKLIEDYVNTDVVLVDIKKTRSIMNLRKMLDIYKDDTVYCMDQGIINYYYAEYLKVFKEYDFNFGVNAAYEMWDETEYKRQVDSMSVLHFAGRKPWNAYDGSYAHALWLAYAKKTKLYVEILENMCTALAQIGNKREEYIHKMDVLFYVLDQFWRAVECGKLSENFRKFQLNSVAVYGAGKIGEHLLYHCRKNGVDVKYILDRGEVKISTGIPVYSPEQVSRLQKVDAIIVTPVHQFDSIKEYLLSQTDDQIISIEELLS